MGVAEVEGAGARALELVHGRQYRQAIPILDGLVHEHGREQDAEPRWLAARGHCHMELGSAHLAARDCAALLRACCRREAPLPAQAADLLAAADESPHSKDPALAPLLAQLRSLCVGAGAGGGGANSGPGTGAAQLCSYCSMEFPDRAALRSHCSTEAHQRLIMSDEGRDWKWRPPPRGFDSDAYALCENWQSSEMRNGEGSCAYGAQCVEAHGADELAEWKERFDYRKMKLQRASEKELYGKSYTELLLERWVQAPSPEKVMREKLDFVEETCSGDTITTVASKVSRREWTFALKTRRALRAVALLQDAHRNHFFLKQVFLGEPKPNGKGHKITEAELASDQEWSGSSEIPETVDDGPALEHRVKVVFSTDIYGTFRQSVVFDFGSEPVLVKHLCVDVIPVTDADRMKEVCEEIKLSAAERWDADNADVVAFASSVYPGLMTPHGKDASPRDRELLNAYPAPRASTICLTQTTVTEKRLTKNNYRTRMHELLYVEEIARSEQVAKFNISCKFRVTPSYILTPSGMAASTAKYAHSGEMFALLSLGAEISEDTSAGRLILNNCTTILFSASPYTGPEPRRVYEAFIEDKGKKMIYLRLSSTSVRELGLKPDTDFHVDIQFQSNRLTFCEWHYAIDKISDYNLIFPDISKEMIIPWSPHHQWRNSSKTRLNVKQKEAVMAITCPSPTPIPPILIVGPFGTGKTYTLAQAIKQLLIQPEAKILICTHSNSAADLYIKDYLHPWLESGVTDVKPLRVYYHKRWVSTVDQVVQKYCLIELNNGVRSFKLPTAEDVIKHRIIVVTLSISMYLSTLGLPKGFFTHILLDEAAQAMESEALMPLALATPSTRIVLAGDHMQLSPELFSQFAKDRNLHISLLERLYEHYPTNFSCKILLCENYRAHEAIISFTSELFYEQMLVASGKQPAHEKFYPLTFFTTRGEDVQDQNSTAFYNNSEVYEVVERICELKKRWPAAWGKMDEHGIGIMTPYADQVFRIRSELRKRRMGGISVERVLNVQGKQFRAIFLSTVRTRRTCQASAESDYGFLSNRKLLNTAITRAQSLVAVVGDPIALCSIGRCRKVWERFISICNDNKSLFGISWSMLRSQLDGVELKKTYTLNPLAKEFVPRAMQKEAYLKYHSLSGGPVMTSVIGPPLQMSLNQISVHQSTASQIPPMMNTPNPIMPYPMFFFPGGANQTNSANMFPINHQSTQPQTQIQNIPMNFNQPINAAVNPWGNSFSHTSPNGRNTPTWSMTNKQVQKKSTMSMNSLQGSQPVVPNSLVPNMIPSQVINPGLSVQSKPHPFIPVPPTLTKHISPEMSPISQNIYPQESFAHNEIPSSQFYRNSSNVPQERILNFLPVQNKFNDLHNIPATHEKDQIQFLQNVHFPERTSTTNQLSVNSNISSREIQSHLTTRDQHSENQDLQNQWYKHLLESQGCDYMFPKISEPMNHQSSIPIQPKPPPQSQPTIEHYMQNNYSRMSENAFLNQKPTSNGQYNINYNAVNGHGQSDDIERLWNLDKQTPMNQYTAKPLNKEFESFAMFHENSNTNRNPQDCSTTDFTSDLSWLFKPSTQSVPLYRRTAGQSGSSQTPNSGNTSHNVIESMEKQNNSTGAFAGYARAFSLQQSEIANVPHNTIMMNGNTPFNPNISYNNLINPQHRLHPQQQQIHTEFQNGHPTDMLTNDAITYASVLRQTTPKLDEDKNDPFMLLKDFGNKSQPHGLYNYFN